MARRQCWRWARWRCSPPKSWWILPMLLVRFPWTRCGALTSPSTNASIGCVRTPARCAAPKTFAACSQAARSANHMVTAAALVSENKVLAHPASVDSITTSGNKEDYVSMGMTAALKLKRITENTRNVLAIEAIAAAQALDFLAPLTPGKRAQAAHAAIRAASAKVEHDRALSGDFTQVAEVIAKGKLAEILSS